MALDYDYRVEPSYALDLFLFFPYIHVLLLIWSKNWNSIYLKFQFNFRLNLGALNQLAQNQYIDVENSLYHPVAVKNAHMKNISITFLVNTVPTFLFQQKNDKFDKFEGHGFYLPYALLQFSIRWIGETESDVADAFIQEQDTIMDGGIASTPL